jgi:hypothetical protein
LPASRLNDFRRPYGRHPHPATFYIVHCGPVAPVGQIEPGEPKIKIDSRYY